MIYNPCSGKMYGAFMRTTIALDDELLRKHKRLPTHRKFGIIREALHALIERESDPASGPPRRQRTHLKLIQSEDYRDDPVDTSFGSIIFQGADGRMENLLEQWKACLLTLL